MRFARRDIAMKKMTLFNFLGSAVYSLSLMTTNNNFQLWFYPYTENQSWLLPYNCKILEQNFTSRFRNFLHEIFLPLKNIDCQFVSRSQKYTQNSSIVVGTFFELIPCRTGYFHPCTAIVNIQSFPEPFCSLYNMMYAFI